MQAEKVQDGRVDFDFLIGRWKVHHRLLRARLKECTDWNEFEGISVNRKILGGLGNLEEVTLYWETGERYGAALRLFDIDTQLWRIYWASGSSGILDVPMVGSFVAGRGEFYAQEIFEGKATFSRFIWTHDDDDHCRWEQALSPDGGKTWETNWTMDFTRME